LRRPDNVMPGFMPGIHVLLLVFKGVDGRDKLGHDEAAMQQQP
jgi:hypothetical protein